MDEPTQVQPVAWGPFEGMDTQDTAGATKCALALNVNFARGNVESRETFRYFPKQTQAFYLRTPQIHVCRIPNGSPMVLIAGSQNVPAVQDDPGIAVATIDGTFLATINLRIAHGEPKSDDWSCSFVDIYVNGTTGTPQSLWAVLITTPFSSYLWVPQESLTTVRRPNMAFEAQKVASLERYYLASAPYGRIAFSHNGSVLYAGFAFGQVDVDGPMPTSYNGIPSSQRIGTTGVRVSERTILWSDFQDAFGVCPSVGLFQVPPGERVTMGRSFREQAIIGSNRGIYSIMGTPAAGGNLQMVPLVRGIGCVGHGAHVEADGNVYFMSWDGFYRFDGQNAEKISRPINALFTGQMQGSLPEAVVTQLANLGIHWPWRIDLTQAQHARCGYYQTDRQVLWAVPIVGLSTERDGPSDNNRTLALTLVYHLDSGAWSVWFSQTTGAYLDNDNIVPGESYFDGDIEKHVCVVNGWGAFYASSLPWDGSQQDAVDPTLKAPVPLIYVSSPVARQGVEQEVFRGLWLRCWSFGKTPSPGDINPGLFMAVFTGEDSAFDQLVPMSTTAETAENRQTAPTYLQGHPRGQVLYDEGLATFVESETNSTYFVNDPLCKTNSGVKTTQNDWWTQKLYPWGHVESKWSRFAIIDIPSSDVMRRPWTKLAGWTWETIPTGAARGS